MLRSIRNAGQGIRKFFSEVPEDTPISDTIGSAIGSREGMLSVLGGVGEHLLALRGHLLRAVIALMLATGLCFYFAQSLMKLLAVPLGDPQAAAAITETGATGWLDRMLAQGESGITRLQVIEPTEAIGVFMKVALLGGVVLAMPWIVFEIFLFVAPGLMPRIRMILLLGIPIVSLFFLAGVLFCYFVMLPAAIPFLYTFLGFKAAWRPSTYFDLITTLMFWVGVTFEMPFVAFLLSAAGIITARMLASVWRIAVVLCAIIAAMITPTVDPVNMMMVMLPMVALYGISILAAAIAGGRRHKESPRTA